LRNKLETKATPEDIKVAEELIEEKIRDFKDDVKLLTA